MKGRAQSSTGFTLIELMIVIAIVAILVTLAVPAYKDFIVRSKVTECISASSPAKTSISEFKQTTGLWPGSMAEAGLYEGNDNISTFCDYFLYNSTVRGDNGDFAVVVDIDGLNISMIFSPVVATSGAIDWTCTRGWGPAATLKYIPASCRGDNIYQ